LAGFPLSYGPGCFQQVTQMNTDQLPDRAGQIPRVLNEISYVIIGAAYKVSSALGSGFLEKVYENSLSWELRKAGVIVEQQKSVAVMYDGRVVGDYVPDLLVNELVVVEVKAIPALDGIHRAQCVNYLRATGLRLALLLNFGRPRLQVARIAL